eukprot:jgi/Psemu1/12328/gm1.12328_g
MTEWATRGCLEPSSIVNEDFETGVFTEGEFVGIEYIWLKPNYNDQKKRSLSLKNPVPDDPNTKKTTLPCPYNGDPAIYSLVPDNCEGVNRIFCKAASKKQMEESAIGKNSINKILVLIATWSGYENPERCTAHGKKHKSISKVANAGVSTSLVNGLGGHAHLNTTTNYILSDQQAVDAALRAKHGSPSNICALVPAPALPLAPALAHAPLAPSPLSPSSSAEESQAPALLQRDSPAVSVQHSFGPIPTTTTVAVCLLRIDRNMRIIIASRDTSVPMNQDTVVLVHSDTMMIIAVADTRIAAAVVDTMIAAVDTSHHDPRILSLTSCDMSTSHHLVKNLAVSLLVKLHPTSRDTRNASHHRDAIPTSCDAMSKNHRRAHLLPALRHTSSVPLLLNTERGTQ